MKEATMQNLTISPLSTLPQVRVLGRCAGTDPLTLFWTGSGIELLFTGSELWVELNADYDNMEPWVSVELDGAWISRFAVNPGTSRMCIFRGAAPGRAKHVRLLKDVQAMSEDPAHLLHTGPLLYPGVWSGSGGAQRRAGGAATLRFCRRPPRCGQLSGGVFAQCAVIFKRKKRPALCMGQTSFTCTIAAFTAGPCRRRRRCRPSRPKRGRRC